MSSAVPVPVDDGRELTRQAWRLLEAEGKDLDLTNIRIQPVQDFLAAAEQHRTSPSDRQTIVDQATLIFDHLYPHFQMRPYLDPKTGWRFIVTSVMNTQHDGGFGHPYFGVGAEIVRWSGIDGLAHVDRSSAHLPGGNFFASLARGAMQTTLRPLMYIQPPFSDEMPDATIHYRPLRSEETLSINLPWGVATGMASSAGIGDAFSISPATIPEVFDFQYTNGPRSKGYIDIADLVDHARPEARFGYIRIKAFNDGSSAPGSTGRLVDEFRRILELMDERAPDGLVIDIRSNPGGDVQAAERMLQMLTAQPIQPARFHLANTTVVLDILRSLKTSATENLTGDDGVKLAQARAELDAWLDDTAQPPLPHGSPLTSGRPLTDPDSANDIGQVYQGRGVALLINSLTYSAADIFAAGFQDHGVGIILGTSMVTGGGGANVWRHEDLLNKVGPRPGIPLTQLPGDATMTLAIRRCSRVGRSEGQPVEDEGVQAEVFYSPSCVDDLIFGNPGILRRACEELRNNGVFRVDAGELTMLDDGGVSVEVRTTNIASLKFFLSDRLALAADPGVVGTYTVPAAGGAIPSVLRIEGYAPDPLQDGALRMVRARTIRLQRPQTADDSDPASSFADQ